MPDVDASSRQRAQVRTTWRCARAPAAAANRVGDDGSSRRKQSERRRCVSGPCHSNARPGRASQKRESNEFDLSRLAWAACRRVVELLLEPARRDWAGSSRRLQSAQLDCSPTPERRRTAVSAMAARITTPRHHDAALSPPVLLTSEIGWDEGLLWGYALLAFGCVTFAFFLSVRCSDRAC